MRIIAGALRGRTLLAPEGTTTRPITDRVKQSLFDILAPRMEASTVFDLFAGTGSMGLECLSRGAVHATFFESDRSGLVRLNQNIMALAVADRSRIVPGDLFKWFHRTNERPHTFNPVQDALPTSTLAPPPDILFLDPPYRFLTDRPDELLQLALHLTHNHMKDDSLLIFRHDARDALALPNLVADDIRTYGDMTIEFLRRQ